MGDIVSANQALDQVQTLEPNNSSIVQERTSLQNLQKLQADANQALSSGEPRKV